MDLIVKDHIIDTPMEVILRTLKSELRNGKLSQILEESDGNIGITCPVHKGGAERRPSCYVMCNKDHKDLEYGTTHCFTCGYKASLPALVSNCFGYSDITLGYIGLEQTVKMMLGDLYEEQSEKNRLNGKVIKVLEDKVQKWKKMTGINFVVCEDEDVESCFRLFEVDMVRYGRLLEENGIVDY